MKRAVVLFLLAAALPAAAKFVPDPAVQYKIDARLDPAAKTIKGRETILWKNKSGDAVPDLQFHLYLNAFKNNYSTFMREGGETSRRVRFRNQADSWGYQQVHSLKVNGQDLTRSLRYISWDDGNPHDQTVARVVLPAPVAPGATVTIEIEWTSKLPHVFARTGFHDNFFFVAQWFPKLGVYEPAGQRRRANGAWNTHQFHTSTEFYADFGTYDVNLTIPSDYEYGATGVQRSAKPNNDGTTTYNHYQEDVHDFAWTAQPKSQAMKVERMFRASEQVSEAEVQEWSRKTGAPPEDVRLTDVKVYLFIQRENERQIDRHFRAAFAAIKWYGLWYGRYPYEVLTVVDPPFNGRGAAGMEYPTLITAGTRWWAPEHGQSPEGVTIHEFGHQYWYGMIANNEFEEAWLDEGFNTYSTGKVLEKEYGYDYSYQRVFGVPIPATAWVDLPVPRYPWRGVGEVPIGQYWEWVPLPQNYDRLRRFAANSTTDTMGNRFAWRYLDRTSYGTQAYDKPALTLATLEAMLGDAWPRVMRTYFARWQFKHPTAQDFFDVVKEVSGEDMGWFIHQTVYGAGDLNYSVSFTSDKEPARRGFFDQNGTPALVEERRDEDRDAAIESEVRVRRLGEMRFPVVIRVRFADGTEKRERWDGNYRWAKFKYVGTAKIVAAEIDPDYTWKNEVHRTDDSYRAEPATLAADKWYLRWVVWIQNVLMAFSFFG
jgi:hypothetical protein